MTHPFKIGDKVVRTTHGTNKISVGTEDEVTYTSNDYGPRRGIRLKGFGDFIFDAKHFELVPAKEGPQEMTYQPRVGDVYKNVSDVDYDITIGANYTITEASGAGDENAIRFIDDIGDTRYRDLSDYSLVHCAGATPPVPAPVFPAAPRLPKAGDRYKNVSDDGIDLTIGKVYVLTEDSLDNGERIIFNDDDGDERDRDISDYELVRPAIDVFDTVTSKVLKPGKYGKSGVSLISSGDSNSVGIYINGPIDLEGVEDLIETLGSIKEFLTK